MPTALIALATAMAVAGWVWLHRAGSPQEFLPRAGVAMLRVLAGSVAIGAFSQFAQRWLLLTTSWPLGPLAVLGAAGVECVLACYAFERRTVARRIGRAMSLLRVAAVLALIAMLAQPVWRLDISQNVRRVVAVLVDQSASMRIRDTQFTPSEKIRMAEALWQGPQRNYRLESAASALADLQARLRDQANSLAVLAQAKPKARQAQLASDQEKLSKDLAQAAATLDEQVPHGRRAAKDQRRDRPIRADVADGRQGAAGVAGGDGASAGRGHLRREERRSTRHEPRDAGGVHSRGLRGDRRRRPATRRLRQGLDEGFYAAMTPAQKAAVDAAVAHTRIEQIRSALKAPLPAADPKEKPQGLLEALDAKYHLKLYTFDTKVSQENTKAWSAQDSPTTAPAAPAAAGPAAAPATAPTDSPEDTSQGTDIAAALGKALADLGSDKLAGVVLISDGRRNANTSLDAATRQVGILQAPVCCMVAGSSRPPMDAAVIAVEAPETVYARNKTFVNAHSSSTAWPGESFTCSSWTAPRSRIRKPSPSPRRATAPSSAFPTRPKPPGSTPTTSRSKSSPARPSLTTTPTR